jgi:hypothetical protein
MLFDDAAAEGEAEARSFPGGLGGEEGLEDLGADLDRSLSDSSAGGGRRDVPCLLITASADQNPEGLWR